MSSHEFNQYVAIGGVFALCMVGVLYHTLALRKMKRDRRRL